MKVKNMLFLMIIFCSLGFIACDDDSPTPDSLDYPFTLENAREDASITQRIDGFGTYLDNLRPDELEPMSIEDVIWSVEARLNSKYTNVAHQFKTLNTQMDTLSITQSGGMMIGTDVIAFYNATLDKLSEHFYSLPDDNRVTVVTDVARINDMPNSLALVTQVGTGVQGERSTGISDSWWWGRNYGTCADGGDGDAAQVLKSELNKRILPINGLDFLTCPDGYTACQWYTTNVNVIDNIAGFVATFTPNPNDTNPNDNYRDYLMYRNDFGYDNWEENKCLSPADMNYYYDGTLETINMSKPPAKDFITIYMIGNEEYLPYGGYNAVHSSSIRYGDIIYSPFTGGGMRVEEIPQ